VLRLDLCAIYFHLIINIKAMIKEEFYKSKIFKILIPLVLVSSLITIFKGGYELGNWLYHLWH
jgi:hypothetical protein